MSPLVSILVPAYNAQHWIADTLRSATAQTWDRKEIIVVDDGSTDYTLEVAKDFESRNVRVITQKNQGAAATRNNALSLCQGEYIQWLDADDLLSADKIARQVRAIDTCPSGRTLLSSAWGEFSYRPYRAVFKPTPLWSDLSPTEWLLRKMGQNLHMQTATWLVQRELAEAAGPWNASLLSDDDGEYFCRILLASDGVKFVPEAKVYYRTSGTGRLSYLGLSGGKIDAQWRSMVLHISYLRSLEDSDRVRTACLKYIQNWLIHFYPEKQAILKQAEQIAMDLGGQLEMPQLSWKYAWIRAAFGWSWAKRARLTLPSIRWAVARSWDRTMLRIDRWWLADSCDLRH